MQPRNAIAGERVMKRSAAVPLRSALRILAVTT
jgi:hypothetical protein